MLSKNIQTAVVGGRKKYIYVFDVIDFFVRYIFVLPETKRHVLCVWQMTLSIKKNRLLTFYAEATFVTNPFFFSYFMCLSFFGRIFNKWNFGNISSVSAQRTFPIINRTETYLKLTTSEKRFNVSFIADLDEKLANGALITLTVFFQYSSSKMQLPLSRVEQVIEL